MLADWKDIDDILVKPLKIFKDQNENQKSEIEKIENICKKYIEVDEYLTHGTPNLDVANKYESINFYKF